MIGRKGYELVKDFAGGEKDQLKPFNENLFNEVVNECLEHYDGLQKLIRKMQEENVNVQETRNADHYGALTHHLSLIKNKRCLMAYVYNRAEIIRNLAWKVGFDSLELPQEIMEKLSSGENNYFARHSDALRTYMGKVDVDLSVDMVPPKDPYVKVRILEDLDAGILLSDMTATLSCNSIHFLKRTDAEKYIALGMMEVLVD